MDLVEIRKKAKEFKKNKLKDDARDKKKCGDSGDEEKVSVEEGAVVDAPLSHEKEPEAFETEEALFIPEKPAPEDADDKAMLPEEEEPLDFLTLAMNTLYRQGLPDADEAGLEKEIEDERLEYLCFMLSDEEYALDIRNLREVIKMMNVTEMPKTPSYVLGIISLRGNIIPLFDLRMRLGLEASEYDSQTRTIVVSNKGADMGLVVDAVTEVVSLGRSELEPPPASLNTVKADLLESVGRCHDRLLIIPNLSTVLTLNS